MPSSLAARTTRRKELVKVAHKYAEAARVAVRHVRRDGLDVVKKLEKNHEISEDDQERLANDVQKATDGTISEIDHLLAAKEKEILTAQIKDKPAAMIEKIAEGKIKDFYKQVCLMEQPFIKEPTQTVRDRVSAVNAKLGENIVVRRFARFEVGEET